MLINRYKCKASVRKSVRPEGFTSGTILTNPPKKCQFLIKLIFGILVLKILPNQKLSMNVLRGGGKKISNKKSTLTYIVSFKLSLFEFKLYHILSFSLNLVFAAFLEILFLYFYGC